MNDQADTTPPPDDTAGAPTQRRLARRVALINGIGILFLILLAAVWFARDALLLLFACILCAVLLYELSRIVHRRLGINRKLALAGLLVLLLVIIGGGGYLMAPQISEQASRLAQEVPAALERLHQTTQKNPLLQRLAAGLPPPQEMIKYLASFVPDAGLFFGGLLGAVGNIVIILFVGIYFATSPKVYIEGVIQLIPPARRARSREVMNAMGETLASWLLGKSVSMLIVGVVTAVGLTLLGVPLALILGIIAGLLDFIPYLGPILAGVPAVLLAFSISPDLALYTILLFSGVQLLEGYLLQPLIEAKAVDLPPALTIVMQLIFGTLFGLAGVALATPLTAALAVIVSMVYIQDVLGDHAKARSVSKPTSRSEPRSEPHAVSRAGAGSQSRS